MDKKERAVRSGYTLPVFACAGAIAAYAKLKAHQSLRAVDVDLISPPQTVSIPIEQVARLDEATALAVTRSDPGDNLDLTRHTPIWTKVHWIQTESPRQIVIDGGEGMGRHSHSAQNPQGQAAIYRYAHTLIQTNLKRLINTSFPSDRSLQVSIILPEGEALAQRTSNEAFGVTQGLSLLGTSGISHALSAPEQLQAFQSELASKVQAGEPLVFCLGENGLDIARKMGVSEAQLIKTANWLGPMLAMAGEMKMPALLLLGYHGKLIKLAGGIFHTHHHLADGRQEILTAIAAQHQLPYPMLQTILASPTVESALQHLRTLDRQSGQTWVERIYQDVTERIEARAANYIRTHTEQSVEVGCALFDRDRHIFMVGSKGKRIFNQILASQS